MRLKETSLLSTMNISFRVHMLLWTLNAYPRAAMSSLMPRWCYLCKRSKHRMNEHLTPAHVVSSVQFLSIPSRYLMLHMLRSYHCPRIYLQAELPGVRGHCSWVFSGNVRSSRVRRFADGDVSSPDDPPGTLLRFLFCICTKFKASFHRWVILLLSTFIQSIRRMGIFAGKFRSFDSS